MDVADAIRTRRSTRSFEDAPLPPGVEAELALAASLAPSCFNRQPWRFVFVSGGPLSELHGALSRGNEWFRGAPMAVAVYSREDLDCVLGERAYYLLDTGMALGLLMLRATEMGLVAHPIAGYDEDAAKRALSIPDGFRLITLVALGRPSREPSPLLSARQLEAEAGRPPRMPPGEFARVLGGREL